MARQPVRRRLAAILVADVAGYGRLMGADEAGTRAAFNALLDGAVRPALDTHRGRLVKTMGDGFLAEFGSVVDAVQCAADIQAGASAREADAPDSRRMELRIGIHLGDVIVEGDDIHGDGVNIAARLEALAEPGGICVSDMVRVGVGNRVALDFADMGEQSLKNIAEPVRVYAVGSPASPEETGEAALALPDKPSIAVLPFDNMSGDPEQEYFSDGIAEDLPPHSFPPRPGASNARRPKVPTLGIMSCAATGICGGWEGMMWRRRGADSRMRCDETRPTPLRTAAWQPLASLNPITDGRMIRSRQGRSHIGRPGQPSISTKETPRPIARLHWSVSGPVVTKEPFPSANARWRSIRTWPTRRRFWELSIAGPAITKRRFRTRKMPNA